MSPNTPDRRPFPKARPGRVVPLDLSCSRLERARLAAGLSIDELWIRYFGNGGTAGAEEFKRFLNGVSWPGSLQFDIVVSALNDRFTEIDVDQPVSYADGSTGRA